ncbi:MAG: cytochrome c3 family protein [Bradymonadia bacterium]
MSEKEHGNAGNEERRPHFVFPSWHNKVPAIMTVAGGLGTVMIIAAVWYYFSPKYTDVGYMPKQPVPYSHKLHAGSLGIDCRYCHTGVEKSAHAGVPPTQTCMNCHGQIKTESPKLLPVRESFASGKPIPWVRVHKTPDYAYFQHNAHIAAGVGCESCHGRIDQMIEVRQDQPLNMGWCLECHRAPENHLRPPEMVTVMGYEPEGGDQLAVGTKLKEENNINPPLHCSGCHR